MMSLSFKQVSMLHLRDKELNKFKRKYVLVQTLNQLNT